MSSVLSRYLNPDVLSQIADRSIDPRGLVVGNLAGAHKSPLSGFAVEFAGHREYVPGDDPKHVDWRVYFSRDKYFVKQYELETNFVCHLIVDISASMRYGERQQQKLMYASQMATALAYSIIKQSDKVSFATFDTQIRGALTPSNALHQVTRITQHLDEIEPLEKTRISDSLSDLAARIGRREIVMLFTDFFGDLDGLESTLQRLRYDQHEVVLFHVLHHDERSFDFDEMTKFVGLEVDEILMAQPDDVRRGYLDALQKLTTQLEEIALRNRCEFVPVDTSRSMSELLADYINQRG